MESVRKPARVIDTLVSLMSAVREMKGLGRLALPCVVIVILLVSVSCERLILDEEDDAVSVTSMAPYPNIQAMINVALDEALVAVSHAAARHAVPDPAHVTLKRALRQARDSNLSTVRAL